MFEQYYKNYTANLKRTYKYRKLSDYENKSIAYVDFSSNDYLGLSRHPLLLEAAFECGKQHGVGSGGSRLLSGNLPPFQKLEETIAQSKNTEAALVFNSGFQANFSTLSTLVDERVLGSQAILFFDKLNHSSLYQAAFLSGAELIRYRHNDMNHLSDLLNKFALDTRPKFIITETVFGMDGDISPLEIIKTLAITHNAFLYLDEAHATGLFGQNGYGLSTTVDLSYLPHLIMGTFSKAIGGSGGYIASSKATIEFLINRAPGFIYSTANSPLVIGAALKAWELIKEMKTERENVFSLATHLKQNLSTLGFDTGKMHSHIMPLILGSEEITLKAKTQFYEKGLVVSCIRPPTVPPGTSRLRIALNAKHTHSNINQLLEALKALL